jgi:hypothetical protein
MCLPAVIVYLTKLDDPLQAVTQTLYISRDPLGRRSLLISRPTPKRPRLLIASVASASDLEEAEWEELSCQEIHTISLADDAMVRALFSFDLVRPLDVEMLTSIGRQSLFSPTLIQSHSRHSPAILASTSPSVPRPFTLHPINRTIPVSSTFDPLSSPNSFPSSPPDSDHPDVAEAADELIAALADSVRLRVENIPAPVTHGDARLGVLFSGGIDCTVVALLASR